MKRKLIYFVLVLLCLTACEQEYEYTAPDDRQIYVEVADMQSTYTRAQLWNSEADIIANGEFALSAYFNTTGDVPYFTHAWTYYFIPDKGQARWRFRDVENQDNLINFYWPNEGNLNFLAYMPRTMERCACTSVTDIKYDNAKGVQFKATLPATITDVTAEDRAAENSKQEFVYASRLNQGRDGGSVKLRFVHPFATVKFRLHQSHRDLVIHSIKLQGINRAGSFSKTETDTYEYFFNGNNGDKLDQNYLTYQNWTVTDTPGELKIDLEKKVPDDINYQSLIGGPYLTIPQVLDNIKLMVHYTWNGETHESSWYSIKTQGVPAWQPGHVYTYTLDLGDNKEEILFRVTTEKWQDGEDAGYENNYEIM